MPWPFSGRKKQIAPSANEMQRASTVGRHANAAPAPSPAQRIGQRTAALSRHIGATKKANAAKAAEAAEAHATAVNSHRAKMGGVFGDIDQLGKIKERREQKNEYDALEAQRQTSGLTPAQEKRHGTIKRELTDDVSVLLKHGESGEPTGIHPLASHYFDMKTAPELNVHEAFHTTAGAPTAGFIQAGIDPNVAKTDKSRMGKAFYVANRMITTVKEMQHHLLQAHDTLRYKTSSEDGHIADLTHDLDQKLVKEHGHELRAHVDSTKPFGPSSMTERKPSKRPGLDIVTRKRADGIGFRSQRDTPTDDGLKRDPGGVNLALLRNFNKILGISKVSEPAKRGEIVKKWNGIERDTMGHTGHLAKLKPTLDQIVKRKKD